MDHLFLILDAGIVVLTGISVSLTAIITTSVASIAAYIMVLFRCHYS